MTAVPLSSMNHKNQSKITEKNMWEVYFSQLLPTAWYFTKNELHYRLTSTILLNSLSHVFCRAFLNGSFQSFAKQICYILYIRNFKHMKGDFILLKCLYLRVWTYKGWLKHYCWKKPCFNHSVIIEKFPLVKTVGHKEN